LGTSEGVVEAAMLATGDKMAGGLPERSSMRCPFREEVDHGK
jgi:hypothetical protein